MEAPVSPTTLGQSLQLSSFPLRRFKETRAAGKGRAWRAPPGVGPGCGAGRASQPSPAWRLPRLHPRCGAAERRPGGAGGSTPTCLGERALSQPLFLGWRRRHLRNAPPSPHSQPPRRLRRSLRDPAPPLRTVLPSTLAAVPGRPHLRAGSSSPASVRGGVRLLLRGGSFAAHRLLKGAREGVPEAPAPSSKPFSNWHSARFLLLQDGRLCLVAFFLGFAARSHQRPPLHAPDRGEARP